jgi:hypothetical protein
VAQGRNLFPVSNFLLAFPRKYNTKQLTSFVSLLHFPSQKKLKYYTLEEASVSPSPFVHGKTKRRCCNVMIRLFRAVVVLVEAAVGSLDKTPKISGAPTLGAQPKQTLPMS